MTKPKRELTMRQTEINARQQHRETEIIKQRLVAEIDETAELAAMVDGQAVVAAVAIEPDRHVIDHLREGERDHDEIDAAGAQAERADDERVQRGSRDRDRPLHEAGADAFLGQNADGVAADAEIGGVAEAHHAAVTQDQIEADRRHAPG